MGGSEMATRYQIISDSYYDSVQLMRVVGQITDSIASVDADAVMGTAANRERLQDQGILDSDSISDIDPDDLLVIAAAPDPTDAQAAVDEMIALLDENETEPSNGDEAKPPKSIRRVCRDASNIDLALISVPGDYAGIEAWNALQQDLHVHLFSDGVPISVERDLKEAAREDDKLLMGPDCGTAIIDGLPLGFANEVPNGQVGIVSASGTGLQAVSSRLARRNVGISQAIGTGGRDLSESIEGLTTRTALEQLDTDSTEVIILISKPPAESAVSVVSESIRASSTPVIVHFQGLEPSEITTTATTAETLAAAADKAISVGDLAAEDPPSDPDPGQIKHRQHSDGKWIRGLFTGGTLCAEAALLADRLDAPVSSNIGIGTSIEGRRMDAHTFTDFGTDEMTDGRPHPMIDPSLRNEHLENALKDTKTAVVLLDIVLGYGAHDDPAGTIADIVSKTESETPIVASVIGTKADPQSRTRQVQCLEDAGVLVAESNAGAARLAIGATAHSSTEIGGESL